MSNIIWAADEDSVDMDELQKQQTVEDVTIEEDAEVEPDSDIDDDDDIEEVEGPESSDE